MVCLCCPSVCNTKMKINYLTVILLVGLLGISDGARNIRHLRELLKSDPVLRRMMLQITAELVGRSLFTLTTKNNQSIFDVVQKTSNIKPFGLTLSLNDNIDMIVLLLKEATKSNSAKEPYEMLRGTIPLGRIILPAFEQLRTLLGNRNGFTEDVNERDTSLVVSLKAGKVRGVRRAKSGVKFLSFFEIPYAHVRKRFQAPVPPKPWHGIRYFDMEQSFCPQNLMYLNVPGGKEDCLHIHVHTPSLKGKNRSVFVWVHGGGFTVGSGSSYIFNPYKVLQQGMVVVYFNYRLGALGFLSTGTKDAPGNAGLKDIIFALKWIQENIEKFGGNPRSVTLYGISSGAATVEYITLSPLAKGLFSGVISGSGSVFNDWAISPEPLKYAFRLGRYLNVNANNTKQLVRSLQKVSAVDIISAAEKMKLDQDPSKTFLPFVPTIETKIPGEEAFLHDSPENIMKSGQYNQSPYMLSFTDKEGLQHLSEVGEIPDFLYTMNENLLFYLPSDFAGCLKNYNTRSFIENKLKEFYFYGQRVSNKTFSNVVDFVSDAKFLGATYKSAMLRFETSRFPIYFFEFAYNGELGVYKYFYDVNISGVAHADDLGYVFTLPYTPIYKGKNKTTNLVSKRLVTMLTNFANYGDPTPTQTKLLPVKWKPIQSSQSLDYLRITDKLEMRRNPNQNRYEFWLWLYAFKRKYC